METNDSHKSLGLFIKSEPKFWPNSRPNSRGLFDLFMSKKESHSVFQLLLIIIKLSTLLWVDCLKEILSVLMFYKVLMKKWIFEIDLLKINFKDSSQFFCLVSVANCIYAFLTKFKRLIRHIYEQERKPFCFCEKKSRKGWKIL